MPHLRTYATACLSIVLLGACDSPAATAAPAKIEEAQAPQAAPRATPAREPVVGRWEGSDGGWVEFLPDGQIVTNAPEMPTGRWMRGQGGRIIIVLDAPFGAKAAGTAEARGDRITLRLDVAREPLVLARARN